RPPARRRAMPPRATGSGLADPPRTAARGRRAPRRGPPAPPPPPRRRRRAPPGAPDRDDSRWRDGRVSATRRRPAARIALPRVVREPAAATGGRGPHGCQRSRRLELRAEILPEDLAHRVLRQLGQEADDLRLLEAREPLAAELAERLGRERLSRPQDDTGGDPLTPLEVGEADHRCLLDAGMRLQDRLDLGGGDVLPPANDHVVLAAGDEEIPLLVP